MKKIAPIILSSILLFPGSSIASDRSHHQINSASSQQISQTPPIDSEVETIRQAQAEAAQKVKQIASAITVRVTSANNGGSGVLIAKKGNTYLVLTNAHVTRRGSQFEIQAPDGQKYTAKPIDGGFDPKYDLALLEFTSQKDYQLADLANPGILKPNDRRIYSAGFPFDAKDIRIAPGEVTQLSDIPFDNGTQIGYEIAKGEKGVRQGMSGGPIFDGTGILLGINTIGAAPILPNYTYNDGSKPLARLAARYREANWGVPVYNFLIKVKPDILYGYKFKGLEVGKIQRRGTLTGYMAKLNDAARKQTVRIEAGGENGSGVIVAKEGNSYYVLTSKHVVENRSNKQLFTDTKIITYDQDNYFPTSTVVAEGLDLAVVKFTSQSEYSIAQLGRYNFTTGEGVLVGGFPGRKNINSPLWQWQLNPGFIFDPEQGKFQTQDNKSFANGYDLIYTSISYGGMSGGPVFDKEGKVIAIHGQAETTEKQEILLGYSQGISIQTFIGIADRLRVKSQLLKISNNIPAKLNAADRQTIITAMENLSSPQLEDDGERWLAYGNQLYRTLQYDKSVAAFETAITKGKGLTGNYGKALSLMRAGKLDLAEIAIAKAIAAVPAQNRVNYYYFWKRQSVLLSELRKYDLALETLEVAIKLEPQDRTLMHQKAILLSSKKKYGAAIKIYDEMIRERPEAYVYNGRGVNKSDLGDNQGAIIDYDKAIKLNPNFADAYSNRGINKSDLGDKQGAIIDYNQAIELNHNFAYAYNNRGNVKSSLGDKQGAIIDYNQAIKLEPTYAMAYNNRGVANHILGHQQDAIADFDRAIKLNPNFDGAYNNRGLAKSDLRDKQAAIADHSQAIKINPNNAFAYNNRGNAKSALGDKQGAITDLDRAIELNPNYAIAYNNRGISKSDLGDKQGAIIDYSLAIKLNPNFAEAYSNRGNAKLALRDNQNAITDLDRAIKLDPNDAGAYGNRGLAKSALGDKSGAISDLTKAAELSRQQGQIDLYKQVISMLEKLKGV